MRNKVREERKIVVWGKFGHIRIIWHKIKTIIYPREVRVRTLTDSDTFRVVHDKLEKSDGRLLLSNPAVTENNSPITTLFKSNSITEVAHYWTRMVCACPILGLFTQIAPLYIQRVLFSSILLATPFAGSDGDKLAHSIKKDEFQRVPTVHEHP